MAHHIEKRILYHHRDIRCLPAGATVVHCKVLDVHREGEKACAFSVDALFLETFKAGLDGGLSNLM